MKFEIDWMGMVKAIAKAIVPFLSGALGGLLSGCSIYGSGIGATM